MPVIFEYLLKLSISIAVIHLFYLLVLRRLTFYNLNRWYLAGYTALCFVIPFIDVSTITANVSDQSVVHIIPTVQAISGKATVPSVIEVSQATDWWQFSLYVLAAGSAALLLRLAGQLFALRKIKRTATAISDGDTPIYHTDKEITPFSFGNNIYLNKNLHTEAELEEIILHEYVHVKQLHTFDIILAELLCIINWYNPFAWFMRHSIRQNLEYIADDNVVNTGLDKKAYQYHLLKVIGVPQYRIANQFNFSSLKNRIMMMNKVRSAKINLLKFMFILPLLAVILVAFRNQLLPQQKGQLTYAIIFYDIDTHQRLSDVEVKEIYGNKTYKADAKGYTAMPVNIQKDKALHISLSFKKSGYLDAERRFQYPVHRKQERSVIEMIGLSKTKNANCKECAKFSAIMQPSANTGNALKTDADYFYNAVSKSRSATARKKKQSVASKPKIWRTSAVSISITEKGKPKTSVSAHDSLVIDTAKKMMTFYGKVKVQDGDKTITANKMTLPQNTWLGWTNALLLIDGVEHPVEDLQNVDEKSVTSIEILKDASATALYGSRAMNGVVRVQTKKHTEKN
ncbi:TonB-dependent receptor plug domain-containing protein [Mucilaginibacter sp. JRF]|uniref:M56 family metallopeptidase n=1 Tax=Mucilaginibacter sp. JRF TaxID=2780088 RepID=UPI001882E34B|nr:M56 family metallopeptidase [Mucilaginibacter sp. JRF]MBE9585318.1 TonB-dependent receptor plug domain-containing protein [Mucilaginibacter sp. JRF]